MPLLTASGIDGELASKASVSNATPATRTAEGRTPGATASKQEPDVGTGIGGKASGCVPSLLDQPCQ